MTPRDWSGLVAINVALPLALSAILSALPAPQPRMAAFFAGVAALFFLNVRLGLRSEVPNWILWPLQSANLAAAIFLGSLSAVTALPALAMLLRMAVPG